MDAFADGRQVGRAPLCDVDAYERHVGSSCVAYIGTSAVGP